MKKKLALIGLNSKLGMKLILDCYSKHLGNHFDTFVIADRSYTPVVDMKVNGITDASTHLTMAGDTLNPFVLRYIYSLLKKEKPDICYFVSAHPMNPVVILFIRLLRKITRKSIKVVSHIHDIFPHNNTKNAFFIDFFQKWQIKLSDKITVYGNMLKKQILDRFQINSERVLAIPHGVNRIEEQECIRTDGEFKLISFLGRIDRYKGIDTFLKVARCMNGKNGVTFFLGGKGNLDPYRDLMRGLSNLYVENRFLDNAEVDKIMRESFVVLLPYDEASQSGVVPVAYYNGCPVIVTNVGGLPEFVIDGETGFIVEPNDVEGIIGKITLIMNNIDLRESMGKVCFDYYKKNLQWGNIFKNIAKFIRI